MMEAGSPLCWPSSPEASRARAAATRASWLRWAALRVSPWMAACEGVPLTQGVVVGGVAHARRGECGEHGVQGGPCLRRQIPADRGHAVDVLAADGEAAPPSAVVLGEVAVGVQAVGELVGQLGQLIGAMLTGQPGQLGFGCGAGLDIDEIRQPMPKAADHRDMAGTQLPVALRFGRRGQHRLQRFTVERPPLAQVGGFVNTP